MNTKNANKQTKKVEEEVKEIEVTSMEIDNVRVIDGKKGVVVFFTLILNDVSIYNCRIATGKYGDFVSWPQVKGKDDKYYNQVYARLSKDAEEAIIDAVQGKIDEM